MEFEIKYPEVQIHKMIPKNNIVQTFKLDVEDARNNMNLL